MTTCEDAVVSNKLKITYRPTESLIPYARNSRTHSPEQVAQIAASIREFGFTNPVLVDEQQTIIAGHGRVLAAQKLGLPEVPTITLAGLSDAQRRAYVIADNKIALNAGWDFEVLEAEIRALGEEDFNLKLLGFDEKELEAIIDAEGADDVGDDDEPKDESRNLLLVECVSERELETLFEELQGRGLQVKVMS